MDTLSSVLEPALEEAHSSKNKSNVDLKLSGDTTSQSAFSDLYKHKKSSATSQEERRKTLLVEQKKRRNDVIAQIRQISNSSGSEDEEDMDYAEETSARLRPRYYKDKLMLSEWLLEVPSDLQENWLTIICPVGKRNLVVAARGKTTTYTKSGFKLKSFPSFLPGGNRSFHNSSSDYCILDCIFSLEHKTFYILDILCWRGRSVAETETEFRFYWLHEKISENDCDVNKVSNVNPFKFSPLPSYKYEDLEQALSKPTEYQVDGLLLYHCRTSYIAGRTPLVGWLKPYMVTEQLNIPVCDFYMSQPQGYVNMRTELAKEYEKLENGMMGIDETDVSIMD